MIEDSGEVKGGENQEERAERRVGEGGNEAVAAGFAKENLVERTDEPPVGSLTCWARYAVCLTRLTELVSSCQK